MAGKIKEMIDAFVNQRAQGNSVLEGVVKIKLILRGSTRRCIRRIRPMTPQ